MLPAATAPRILVADDDEISRLVLAQTLRVAGYEVVETGDGREALAAFAACPPALAVLDVSMPHLDGFAVVAELRQRGFEQPVLLLTAHGEIDRRVRGFTAGADDYLLKPFERRELLARLQARLRRPTAKPARPRRLRFGAIAVDLEQRSATLGGRAVGLTRTEFAMLDLLARNPGRPVAREALLEGVWGYGAEANTRTVETHVWRLRKKIDDGGETPRWLQTRHGIGYVLTPEVFAAGAGD